MNFTIKIGPKNGSVIVDGIGEVVTSTNILSATTHRKEGAEQAIYVVSARHESSDHHHEEYLDFTVVSGGGRDVKHIASIKTKNKIDTARSIAVPVGDNSFSILIKEDPSCDRAASRAYFFLDDEIVFTRWENWALNGIEHFFEIGRGWRKDAHFVVIYRYEKEGYAILLKEKSNESGEERDESAVEVEYVSHSTFPFPESIEVVPTDLSTADNLSIRLDVLMHPFEMEKYVGATTLILDF